jgi:UDP-glucose 4-epimerase
MKVLVTGGAGYIGAHVSELLQENGYSVRIFDDFSNGLDKRVKNFKDIFNGDITDREAVLKSMEGMDAVIHLAAKKAVGESVSNPLKYYTNNVGGTMNVLAAMSLKKVKKLVFSSSAAVYSPSEKDAIEESDPTDPLSPYGATKLLSEQLISKVGQAEGFSTISLRYFNVVGSKKVEFGDNSRDNLVPKVFAAFKEGKSPEIYGADYPTKDGTCIRDYIHVQDLAEVHLVALKQLDTKVNGVYNVGSGTGYSVKEIFDQLEESMAVKLNPVTSARRPGDSPKLIASIKKIEKDLGWRPKATLKEMIDSAWAAEKGAK